MRRALTLAIVMLFGLTPLCALIPGSAEVSLPACCRRHGAHHCAMKTAASQPSDSSPGFAATDHCPQYRVQVRAITPAFVLAGSGVSHDSPECRIAPTLSGHLLASTVQTHTGRGPPVIR